MQDKSINNALLALRKQIIRGNLDGLAHVEALLTMRAVQMPRVFAAKCPTTARKRAMARMMMQALQSGPMTRRQLVDHISVLRPEVPPDRIYWRVDAALAKLHKAGVVGNDNGVWLAR